MKGVVYTLEVLFAAALILITLTFVFQFSPPTVQYDIPLMKEQGAQALAFMDSNYDMRKWVADGDILQLRSTLDSLLPDGLNSELVICRNECNAGLVPVGKSVVAVDYYVSSYNDEYLGYKLRLWMWR